MTEIDGPGVEIRKTRLADEYVEFIRDNEIAVEYRRCLARTPNGRMFVEEFEDYVVVSDSKLPASLKTKLPERAAPALRDRWRFFIVRIGNELYHEASFSANLRTPKRLEQRSRDGDVLAYGISEINLGTDRIFYVGFVPTDAKNGDADDLHDRKIINFTAVWPRKLLLFLRTFTQCNDCDVGCAMFTCDVYATSKPIRRCSTAFSLKTCRFFAGPFVVDKTPTSTLSRPLALAKKPRACPACTSCPRCEENDAEFCSKHRVCDHNTAIYTVEGLYRNAVTKPGSKPKIRAPTLKRCRSIHSR